MKIRGHKHHEDSKKTIAGIASKLGLKGYASNNNDFVEIVAEGHGETIWELVKSCTSQKLDIRIKEILFYFAEPQNNFSSFSLN